jgi:hypothetical protein
MRAHVEQFREWLQQKAALASAAVGAGSLSIDFAKREYVLDSRYHSVDLQDNVIAAAPTSSFAGAKTDQRSAE